MIGRFMDWMMDGPMPWAFAKMTAVILGLTAAIMAPFVYVGHQNAQALTRTFNDLDSRLTVVFQNAAACEAARYPAADCRAAQDRAVGLAGGLGTSLSYDSAQKCATNHGLTCREETTMIPITTYSGNVPITTYTYSTSYHPPAVAFQAARDDLRVAVPLYPAADSAYLLRRDGRLFPHP